MRPVPVRRRVALLAAAVAPMVFVAPRSTALDIVLNYNAGASVEPSYDLTGAGLTDLMQHVESVYQDIFEDSHTLTINYWWEDLADTTVGLHSLVTQAGGRETVANLRLDTRVGTGGSERAYFMDPTPANNSEFNMAQTLWRDLTPTQQTNFYNFTGPIPATFEVGFAGTATAGAPAAAQNNIDALTVLFHEVGHALGMSSANNSTVAETGDDDYDLDSVNIFGATLAAEVATGSNIAHLDSSFSLMFPSVTTGLRTLPSHTDLLSMAAVHNYTALDIPRREFYGNSNWNNDANWVGNTVPSTADECFIRNAGTVPSVTLSAAGFAGTLSVSEGANITTNAFKLDITNTLTLSDVDTDGTISLGGEIEADLIIVQNSAELRPAGGLVDANTLTNASLVIGFGTIDTATSLGNGGTISASGGTLTLTSLASTLNLDGSSVFPSFTEPGVLNATAADLVIDAPLADDFNGVINVGNSQSITFNDAWDLGGNNPGTISLTQDGVLNLNGGTTSGTAAVLNGALATVLGDINVTNYGLVNAPATFLDGATVVVNSGGTLELNGTTTFAGGSFTGAGWMILDALTTVTGDTTIAVANLDLDGFVPIEGLTINNAATLTISSEMGDFYSGTLNVQGQMIVNNSGWGIDGSLILGSGVIGGTGGVTISGDVSSTSTSSIDAPATFTSAATVSVPSGELRLTGPTTFLGGTYTGAGTLTLDGDQVVAANTTFAVSTLNWDGYTPIGTFTVNSGVVATFNVDVIESGGGAYDGTTVLNSATLAVNTLAAWINSGTINLNDTGAGASRLLGTGFTSSGTLNFSGTNGGRIQTTLTNTGRINVGTNSLAVLTGATTFASSSNVVVNNNGELFPQGATIMQGGSYTGEGLITQGGNLTINGSTTINTLGYDWDGNGVPSNTVVNGGFTFTINSKVIEDDDASHGGIATLNGSTLSVNTSDPWTKAGTLAMNFNAIPARLTGQTMILAGQLDATGGAEVIAPLRMGGGVVNVISSTLTQSGQFSSAVAGTLTKIGGGTWAITGTHSHGAGAVLALNAGQTNISQDAGAGGDNLAINLTGSLGLSSTQHLNALNIAAGGLSTQTGAGNQNVLRVRSYSLAGPAAAPTASINLVDETMMIDYAGATPAATVRAHLQAGYNGNLWTGPGIRSTAAAGNPATRALGYAETSDLSSSFPLNFAGELLDSTAIVIRYTLPGDANLDRKVNTLDFNLLAGNFNLASGNRWYRGDFNYNGTVTSTDFNILVANYGSIMPAAGDLPEGALPLSLGSVVPEPGVMSAAVMSLAMLTRRRRE